MNIRHIILTVVLFLLLTTAIVAGSSRFFGRAMAAPPAQVATPSSQEVGNLTYASVSSLVFVPVNPDAFFRKDTSRQLLVLNSPTRDFPADSNRFIAPLNLGDQDILTGMTIFGDDVDNQGEVKVRLKRCDHGQPRCINVAEVTSTNGYASGEFESIEVAIANEIVDNGFYSYLLELELTALGNSGLRSVRLELIDRQGAGASPGEEQRWSLSGSTYSFPLPNLGLAEVRVCTNDLSHLDNSTHFPILEVDGRSIQLASNSCVTEQGREFELSRRLNTGSSSGTFQILR